MRRHLPLFVCACAALLACRTESFDPKGSIPSDRHPRQAIGFTVTGDVALFDVDSGVVKNTAEGGGGTPRDVTLDPEGRVWVFEENEEGSGGEIRVCAL